MSWETPRSGLNLENFDSGKWKLGMESSLLPGTLLEESVGLTLSPHYPRKNQGSFLLVHKYKESHTPKSIEDA